MEETNTETLHPEANPDAKLNKLDSLSNLGTDSVNLSEDTQPEEDTMTVQPLKAISQEEYEALAMLSSLVNKIYEEAGKQQDDKANPLSDLTNDTEKELYIKMAQKFGLKNIELLQNTNVRFRLRSGHFIEVYNA